MKFMVMVNSKYMVSVEAESLCGAEHVILDKYSDIINRSNVIKSAQAFKHEDMGKAWFINDYFNFCETISIEALDEKIKKYTEAADLFRDKAVEYKDTKVHINDIAEEIKRLSDLMEREREKLLKLEIELDNLSDAAAELKNF